MIATRLVFDTNTVISAMCFVGSFGDRAFRYAVARPDIELCGSNETIGELIEVADRSKFDRFVPSEERALFVASYLRHITMIVPTKTIAVCRDPKDDKFLELAVAAKAACIVSRDDDLTILHPFRGIRIVDAETYLRTVEK